MAMLEIIDLKNSKTGEIELPASIESAKVSNQVIFDQVIAEQAGKRQGTHSTLTKAEVRGGGKKPVPQKHTGNARQGSIRNPHYVGGGVVFGPKPNRNYRNKVNKKVSKAAFIGALAQRAKDIIVLDNAALDNAKTKDFANLIKLLKLTGTRMLFAFCDKHTKAIKSVQNIKNVEAKLANQVSVLDILRAKKIFVCADTAKMIFGGNK